MTILLIVLLKDLKVVPCQIQKQPSKGVLRKRRSENIQQIYRRKPTSKGDLDKVAMQLFRAYRLVRIAYNYAETVPFNKILTPGN